MVSSVSGCAGYSAALQSASQARGMRDPAALQEKLFSKLDVDGSGGIDQSELKDFLSFAASSTQGSSQVDSAQAFSALDSDGDGSVTSTELADGARSLFDALRSQLATSDSARPPPPPAPGSEQDANDLFATMDANGDGAIDQDELGTFLSANTAQAAPERGGGFLGKLDSLLDQYRSTSTSTVDSTASSSLSIAA
jgi:Ca2+-binding EF-hand superfamily protein